MSYAVEYEVPGDEGVYEKVKAEIGDEQPSGLVVTIVEKVEGGLRHLQIWDSKEQWERFRDERVQPAVARFLDSIGFTETPLPPEEKEMAIVDVLKGA